MDERSSFTKLWLPDWKKEEQYPIPETAVQTEAEAAEKSFRIISGNEFAWEFLRRNPSYQEDYQKAIRECIDVGYPLLLRNESLNDDFLDLCVFFQKNIGCYIPEEIGIDFQCFVEKCPSGEVSILFDMLRDIATNYGFSYMLPNPAACCFLVGYYLEEENFKASLKEPTPKYQPSKFPIYLRLLDAESSNASISEIKSILFCEHEGYHYTDKSHTDARSNALFNHRKAAHRLRDRAWRTLL